MRLIERTLRASRVLSATQVTPSIEDLPERNLRFSEKAPADLRSQLSGCGLYALAMDGRVAYVGSFASNNALWDSDIVFWRWHRHLSTITCRGYKTNSPPSVVPAHVAANPECALGAELIRHPAFNAGKAGYSVSAMRLRFASRHWHQFRNAEITPLLDRFTFTYVQIDQDRVCASVSSIREVVKDAETAATAICRPLVNGTNLPPGVGRKGFPWRPADQWHTLEEATRVLANSLHNHATRLGRAR